MKFTHKSKNCILNFQLEAAMNYIHDGLMLDESIDTLERCVSIYTFWLAKLKASNFRNNDKASLSVNHGLPEWFYEHTESIFKTMLGVSLFLYPAIC